MRGAATIRRETPARELAAGATVRAAMVAAGYTEKSAKAGLIRHGRKLISPWDHPEVAAQVAEIREGARERAQITTADIVQRLEDARTGAMEDRKYSAAVSATMGMAKVLGLIADKVDMTMKPISEMTEDELKNFVRQNGLEDQLAELHKLYGDDDTVH